MTKQQFKPLKYAISIVLALIFLFVGGTVALAWDYNGWQWYDGVDPLYYKFYNGTSQETQDAFTMAAYYWETASDSPVNYTYTTGNANIYAYEVSNQYLGWMSGKTDIEGSMPYITQAYVYLNTYVTSGYPAGKRISVAGHELGHAIGHSHNDWELMDGSDYWRWEVAHIESPTYSDIYYTNQLYP